MPPSNTPAEPCGAFVSLFPQDGGLPRFDVGSASATKFRGLLDVHCTLQPACSLNPHGTLFWKCFSRSRCLLPPPPALPAGETEAGWESHPLKIAAFPRHTPKTNGNPRPLADLKLLAPIARLERPVVAVGLNYKKHSDEGARRHGLRKVGVYPQDPVFFCKWPGSHNGPEGEIVHHALTRELDYECELVVVIGKQGINIPKERAMDHVYGYTIMNEVSARDVQHRHGQWFKGKGLDTFGPLGPWIVTKEETGDGNNLAVQTRVNGEVRQNSSTSDMIFDIATIVSVLSEGFTLRPGDLIATGTPEGVGFAMDPPRTLHPGDVVECEIERIGVLRNRVVTPRP